MISSIIVTCSIYHYRVRKACICIQWVLIHTFPLLAIDSLHLDLFLAYYYTVFKEKHLVSGLSILLPSMSRFLLTPRLLLIPTIHHPTSTTLLLCPRVILMLTQELLILLLFLGFLIDQFFVYVHILIGNLLRQLLMLYLFYKFGFYIAHE